MTKFTHTAIIGAGPYGLSLAAHLAHAGADFRVFGTPMATWRDHMPKGMMLKSDGFASNLSSPDPSSTLKAWCAERDVEYDDLLVPVKLEVFQAYSAWFQQTFVPMLEDCQVVALKKSPRGFFVTLDSGETLEAEKVVMTVGISWFCNVPDLLAGLPAGLASHSYDHQDMSPYAGKKVLVLGAGSSAVDMAVTAQDAGADVTLLARAHVIHYHSEPDPSAIAWLSSLTRPSSGIGPGWKSFLFANLPRVFRRMPEPLRLRATKRHLGPALGWFMRGRLKSCTYLGHNVESVRAEDGRVALTARDPDGKLVEMVADHVIAATGFYPDLRRLPFLDDALRAQITHVVHTPKLSDHFETSVPGLYATGPLAANAFGPLMRFMVGAEYAAPRIAAHLLKAAQKKRAAA